jgi:4-hydroxybenzoate-CoA ligase/benzoate-CoA ligase
VVSSEVYARVRPAIDGNRALETVLVAGPGDTHGQIGLENALLAQPAHLEAAPTTSDDIAFWLYSSGSTGAPKAAMHLQSSLVQTAALFGRGVLGIQENDVILSSEKLFFAYGLGNSMTFPLHVGGSAGLVPEQATSTTVRASLRQHHPTLFASVPSLFVSMLADPDLDPAREAGALRACVSAGEALPAYVGERWRARFGVDIVDGLGSTEMLHIFLSNRPGGIGYGTAGKRCPGTSSGSSMTQGESCRTASSGSSSLRVRLQPLGIGINARRRWPPSKGHGRGQETSASSIPEDISISAAGRTTC